MQFLLFLLLFTCNTNQFCLAADLERGKHILSQGHGVGLYKENRPYKLSIFDKYTLMNLSGFVFSKKQRGKYNLSLWKQLGKRKLEIYQVESILHVDNTFITANYTDSTGKRTVKKTHIVTDFNYRTYIINDDKKPKLIFTIAIKGDHLNYSIGEHDVYPLYESIPIGLKTPDEKEILRVINQ